MHIHYFQHDHFEDLGYIGDWAESHNYTISVTRFDLKPEFPVHDDYDWLVVLGGKMSVNDSDQYPWITPEIKFIKEAIALGKVVLGICLGSQLVANALGARVTKNTEPEMGFFPVIFNQDAHTDIIFRHFPLELKVMHMHFDIFDLPEGAVAMASSLVTPVQAFRYGNTVFALQFHFEITESNAPVFIREVTPEIIYGTQLVQNPSEMLQKASCCQFNNQVFEKMLDEIVQLNSGKQQFQKNTPL
ncbi:MAG: type 1 glutamine amidotransferase [Lentimicrobiaceae bacterium]|jgi:GMP synthase (glutamine-hydrolysing)